MYRARNTINRHNCIELFCGKENRTFIVFDTETTGIDPSSDYIVELAANKYIIQNKTAVKTDEIDIYMRPPFPMTQTVIDIHHITNERLEHEGAEEDRFEEIKGFFGDRPILVGHNIDFDIRMLSSLYSRNNCELRVGVKLDTLEMARDVLFGKDIPDYSLKSLTVLLGLDIGITFHSAADDIKATMRLLSYLFGEYLKMPEWTGKDILYINYMYFWKGYRKEQMGIYVNTNMGTVFYSTFRKAWYSKEVDLSKIDINNFENRVLFKTRLSLPEFGKLTEKKFRQLKERRRQEGVYL